MNEPLTILRPSKIELGGGIEQTIYTEIRTVFATIKQKSSSFGESLGSATTTSTYEITIRKPLTEHAIDGEYEIKPTHEMRLVFWHREFRIIGIDESDKRYYKIKAIEI